MLIAISQRQDKNKYRKKIDNLENNYVNYLEKFGIQLVVIPNSSENIASYFEKLPIEAIIISGGNNINSELYGRKLEKERAISKERDATEKKLLEIAIEKNLPVLGICRGMQFINVFFKGKLVQIKDEVNNVIKHVKADHTITITDERVKKLLGEKAEVNSYHNQGITNKTLSPELKSFAQTSDGVIEGIYNPSLPIVGIEWHPERKSPDEEFNKKIIEVFLKRELFWKK